MTKKTISIIISITLIIVLMGCSSTNSTTSKDNKETVKLSFKDEGATLVEIKKEYHFDNPFVMPYFEFATYYDERADITIPYRFSLPLNYDKNKKYPVVLFFHGNGSIGTDNQRHLWGITSAFPVAGDIIGEAIVILPQSPSSWNRNFGNGILNVAVRLTDKVVNEYGGDKNRIYATGLSLGGFATWDALDEYPDYFAAAVPVCGGVYTRNIYSYVNTPIWTYHGNADNIVDFNSTKTTYDSIIEVGGKNIKFIELDGVEHNAWTYAYTDREMLSWLFSQKLGSHQNLDYTYRNYFEIVSPSGKAVVTEKDISNRLYTDDEYIDIVLNEKAAKKLKYYYIFNSDKNLTLKIGSQKLYDFKITSFSNENIIRIEKTVEAATYNAIFDMLQANYYNNQTQKLIYKIHGE